MKATIMDAAAPLALAPFARANAAEGADASALGWARIYHFLELALAHPGEVGFDYFRRADTEAALQAALRQMPQSDEFTARAEAAAGAFFAGLRRRSFAETEAEHIALFSANFPIVPCPPYGSLFTVEESKRLEEMLAIKQFYHGSGVDISDSYDDLPDHLCVELEFLQLLCFRLQEMITRGDEAVAAGLRRTQAEFLDRFLLPFAQRLAQIAGRMAANNPYAHLLDATRLILAHHRRALDDRNVPPSPHRENAS